MCGRQCVAGMGWMGWGEKESMNMYSGRDRMYIFNLLSKAKPPRNV